MTTQATSQQPIIKEHIDGRSYPIFCKYDPADLLHEIRNCAREYSPEHLREMKLTLFHVMSSRVVVRELKDSGLGERIQYHYLTPTQLDVLKTYENNILLGTAWTVD